VLLLTTKGRRTGLPRTVPLNYQIVGDDYIVIASKCGAPTHPYWYLNLAEDPHVGVQVLAEVFPARACTTQGAERARLWRLHAQHWPDFDEYQKRTDREIPVVLLGHT
jgi:deazaflavin-dependent oxidoreductase (nitroreductase family)